MSRPPGELLNWTEPDPRSASVDELVAALAAADSQADEATGWPADLWTLIENAGSTRWSLPAAFGGEACPRPLLVQRYAQLASGSLTAVFILSQHDAAVRRLTEDGANNPAAAHWLREIGAGRAFTTVGISHLTTSRRLRRHRSRDRSRVFPDGWSNSLGHGGPACTSAGDRSHAG